jgi:hypothetical protein
MPHHGIRTPGHQLLRRVIVLVPKCERNPVAADRHCHQRDRDYRQRYSQQFSSEIEYRRQHLQPAQQQRERCDEERRTRQQPSQVVLAVFPEKKQGQQADRDEIAKQQQ